MKNLYLLVASLILMACGSAVPMRGAVVVNGYSYGIPAGHQRCQTNYDCHAPQYCGFIGVNTVPVCRQ